LWILYTSKHCEFEIGKIAAHTLKSDITQLYNSLLTYSQNKNVSILVQRALLYESMEKYKMGAEDL
ncbi:unnamed protein product, partial [Brassica rapa subsp. narinosa]